MEIITKTLDENINILPNQFVFDIETTGLSPKFSKVILIGILYKEDNKTVVKQFFANNTTEEKELLIAFIDAIADFNKHITFNGHTFDIPFLNYRFKKYDIDFSLNKDNDMDILKLIRPFKEKLSLSDCKLKTVEKYLGICREDTISGKESVDLYKEYENSQVEELKSKILLHNYEDIYYLGHLYDKLNIIEDNLKPIVIDSENFNLSLVPLSYKFSKDKLIVKYTSFYGTLPPVSIYKDSYSILSNNDILEVCFSIDNGNDDKGNKILYFNISKIVPLKFNDDILENNIYTLCNFIIKKELKSIYS